METFERWKVVQLRRNENTNTNILAPLGAAPSPKERSMGLHRNTRTTSTTNEDVMEVNNIDD